MSTGDAYHMLLGYKVEICLISLLLDKQRVIHNNCRKNLVKKKAKQLSLLALAELGMCMKGRAQLYRPYSLN